MNTKSLSLLIIAAPMYLVAVRAIAQTALPANVQNDRATIQQDQTLAQTAMQQLRTDEAAGNTAAVAADRTALRLARMKVGQDFGPLRLDAQPIVQPHQAALTAALTQLYSDQHAGNASAAQADQAAVIAAEAQLRSDREAIYGGLGRAGRGHRRG